jgi:hypothetical protein
MVLVYRGSHHWWRTSSELHSLDGEAGPASPEAGGALIRKVWGMGVPGKGFRKARHEARIRLATPAQTYNTVFWPARRTVAAPLLWPFTGGTVTFGWQAGATVWPANPMSGDRSLGKPRNERNQRKGK